MLVTSTKLGTRHTYATFSVFVIFMAFTKNSFLISFIQNKIMGSRRYVGALKVI